MQLTWFPVNAINEAGETCKIEDPAIWQEIWAQDLADFDLLNHIGPDLKAEVWVMPQEEGCLVRGKLAGSVHLPCARCTENVIIAINHQFDTFEPYPGPAIKRLNDLAPGKAHDKGRRRNEEVQARKLEEITTRDSLIEDPDVDEEVIREMPDGRGMEINLSALLWQELVLSLPVKVLCSNACKGLCHSCGQNLNQDACTCNNQVLDPRLAILRNVKIEKK